MIKFLTSPATVHIPGYFEIEGLFVVVASSFLIFIAFFSWTLIWLARDAKKRNKNILVAILFILFTGWPLSFIWWHWLRPSSRVA